MAHATAGVRQDRAVMLLRQNRSHPRASFSPPSPARRAVGSIREIRCWRRSRGPTRSATLALHEIAQQRNRLRSRCYHLTRPRAEPQPELQIVPRRFHVAPGAQLIAPRRAELRPAQPFRLLRREQRCLDAVRPRQPPLARLMSGRFEFGQIERRPDSTIVSRVSAAVGPTNAIRATLAASARDRTHSAPVRVLPHPRPDRTSQIDQSPVGGSCSGRAIACQSVSSKSARLPKGNERSGNTKRLAFDQLRPAGELQRFRRGVQAAQERDDVGPRPPWGAGDLQQAFL